MRLLAAMLTVWSLSAATASAQVCGDVDGSGAVSVSDGVAVLRAAAGLPASLDCRSTPSECDLTSFANGTGPGSASSVWRCRADGEAVEFAVYADFTGLSSDIGPFSFLQNGCRSGIATAFQGPFAGEQAVITEIGGSTAERTLRFRQEGFGLEVDVVCELISF